MIQNLVLNNSDHNFSAWADGLRVEEDKTKVTGSPGSDAAVLGEERAQLEAGTLTSAGTGIHAEHSA
jgi:hypothetical protein